MKAEYSISELAREFKVTPRTLRHYEDVGLIAPQRRGSNRLFGNQDRARLKLILRGTRLGLTLVELRQLFTLYQDARRTAEARLEFLEKVGVHKAALVRQRAEIDAMLDEMRFFEKQCEKLHAQASASSL